MKSIITFVFLLLAFASYAQKELTGENDNKEKPTRKNPCDSIAVDFETGMLNGKINAGSPVDSIKKYLPCITAEIPFGSDVHVCGGGTSLQNHGIYFNQEHGFIEFSSTTKALLPVQVMGFVEDTLAYFVGDPTQVTDLQPYTDRAIQSVYMYPKSYGCLTIWVDQKDKKVFKIQLHNQPPTKAILCIE